MKKYYKVKKILNAYEAMDYLRGLTEAGIFEHELMELIKDEALNCYIDPLEALSAFGDGSIGESKGMQKIVPNYGNITSLSWVYGRTIWGGETAVNLIFSPYADYDGDALLVRRKVDLYGTVTDTASSERTGYWEADAKCFNERGEQALFLRRDIEALAAKMNDEPDPKAMQEENQRLRQELKDLKDRYGQTQGVAKVAVSYLKEGTDALRGLNDNELKEIANKLNKLQLEVIEAQKKNAELRAELDRLQTVSKYGGGLLGYESENLRLAEWAINEFYHPDMFDINDPKTYPKQEFMVSEIMRVHGVSGATAKAIERVITPFSRDRAKK